MTSLEKKLRALANGKDLPWDQTKALLERLGAEVIPPRSGGSHFKIVCKGYSTCTSLYTKTLSKRFMHVRLQIY